MTVDNKWFNEQPERYIGSVQEVREQEGDYGLQIVVEVLPLGESVARPIFFSASNSPRSKWIKWLKTWADLGVRPEGPDDLVDKIVMLENVPRTYTIDGETRESNFYKPVKLYDSETDAIPDLDELRESGSMSTSSDSASPSPEAAPAQEEITDELVEQARVIFESLGSDPDKFLGVASSSWNVDAEQLLEAVQA